MIKLRQKRRRMLRGRVLPKRLYRQITNRLHEETQPTFECLLNISLRRPSGDHPGHSTLDRRMRLHEEFPGLVQLHVFDPMFGPQDLDLHVDIKQIHRLLQPL